MKFYICIQEHGLKKDEAVTDLCILEHTPVTSTTIYLDYKATQLAAERGGGHPGNVKI